MNTIQIRLGKMIADDVIMGRIMSGDGRAYMSDSTFTTREEGVMPPDSSLFRLDDTAAQVLMDQLWDCGVRPTEGAGSAGAMAMALERIVDLKLQCNDLWDVNRKLIGELTGKAIE